MARRKDVVVSGPGIDRSYDEVSVGVSAAITFACRSTVEATYYVREHDKIVARVERDEHGNAFVYSTVAR